MGFSCEKSGALCVLNIKYLNNILYLFYKTEHGRQRRRKETRPDSLISFNIFKEETFNQPAEGRTGVVQLRGNYNKIHNS